jgi:hypothetical protein
MGRPRAVHCKRGHEFTAENSILNKYGKGCRLCKNANAKIRYNASEELRKKISVARLCYRARLKQRQEDQNV